MSSTTTAPATDAPDAARYRVTGMDCPSCAAKIEKAARGVPGVKDVKVSIASPPCCMGRGVGALSPTRVPGHAMR